MTETREIYTPGVIFPQLTLEPECYASLKMRLDLYQDMIMATHYEAGRPGATFAVDPADLGRALSDMTTSSGLLPPNCLFWQRKGGNDRLGIYVEPGLWAVSIQADRETWHVPLPGFIFIGEGKNYSMYAVKLPPTTPETKLYNFPAPNVGGLGVTCQGNAPFPQASGPTIWDAAHVFFQSEFNKHLINSKSKTHPGNILDVWAELNEAEAQCYPVADLVSANVDLGVVIDAA